MKLMKSFMSWSCTPLCKPLTNVSRSLLISLSSCHTRLFFRNDDDCIKILRNCHRALPEQGKVIAVEIVLPAIPEATPVAQNPFRHDVIMLNNFRGGKERTEQEFAKLAKDSGFDGEFRSTYIFASYWALEFSK
nr:unnamed protein product [Digitaria exilis]